MTYNPAVPLNSDSPSLLPGQCQANFTRLQTLLGADHQFNLTATADDGFHNLIHMLPQAPTGALAGVGRLYVKTVAGVVQLTYMTSAGVEYQITPAASAAGIFAAVNFNGIDLTIRSQTNVSSVTRAAASSSGAYAINFTAPAANANYIVVATGQRKDSAANRGVTGFVISANSYGVSQTINKVNIGFKAASSDADFQDVLMGNVLIYQV
jgi:hypothetical protein